MSAGRRSATLLAVVAAGALTVGTAMFAPSAVAAGTTRLVSTSGTDTGNCVSSPCATLQYAVDQSDSGDTISVAGGSYAQSVEVSMSLTLVGAGSTGSGRTTLSGDPQSGDQTILVDGGASNVTIKDMDVSGNGDESGIVVENATATIHDCAVSDNDDNGVWVEQGGTATITGTTVRGNDDDGVFLEQERTEVRPAAAVALPSATVTNSDLSSNDESGIDVEDGTASVDHSTINGNEEVGADVEGDQSSLDISTTTLDANSFFGVDVEDDAQVTLTDSTVSNTKPGQEESTTEFGGGVSAFNGGTADVDTSTVFGNTGQGILNVAATVTVENSTISGTLEPADEGSESGGIEDLPYGGIAVAGEETLQIRSAVKALSHSDAKAAGVKPAQAESPSTTVTGSIVADNTSLADCNATGDAEITDGGYNLDTDGSCDWSATGSISNGTPKLGPLADNGGPTQTLLPAKGSDAIDVIPSGSAGCSAKATDQRGVSRPQGPKCDIGAVEADQPPIVITPASLPHGVVGTAYSAQLHASGGLGAPYEFSLAGSSGPLPPGLTLGADGSIGGTPTQAGTFPITVSVDDPTTKDYTIVIAAPTAPSSSVAPTSTAPVVAETGANVTPLTTYGLLALLLGALLTLGGIARYVGRHRAH